MSVTGSGSLTAWEEKSQVQEENLEVIVSRIYINIQVYQIMSLEYR